MRGKHNAALFYSAQMDVRMAVHGDDFLCPADDDGLQHVDDKLRSRYTVKDIGTLGPDEKDVRKLNVLNRTFVFGTDVRGEFVDILPDHRHASIIIQESGCDSRTKAVATPREKIQDATVLAGQKSRSLRRMRPADIDQQLCDCLI